MQKLTSIITDFIAFLNGTLVPLVFAIAFIVFLWGVFRYFIAGADNPEKRDSGRQFVVYGIVGFFLMLSVWGLVNLLMGTFNLDTNGRPCLPTFGTDANCTGGTAGSQNEPLQPGTNLPGIY